MADVQVHPNLKVLRDLYTRIFNSWMGSRDAIQTDPSVYGVPNLTRKDFEDTIFALRTFIDSTEAPLHFSPVMGAHPIRHGQWNAYVSQIESHIPSLPNTPQNWPIVSDNLFAFNTQIINSFLMGPNFASDPATNAFLKEKTVLASEAFTKAEQISTTLEASREKASVLILEAQNAVADSKALALKISTDLAALESYSEGLNRKGLGESFVKRATEMKYPAMGWLASFFVCILIICCVSLVPTLLNVFRQVMPTLPVEGNVAHIAPVTLKLDPLQHLLEMLMRIIMTAPVIWAAWFSAKQYSVTRRLREDYEFKAASAMAYYGYHREAAQSEDLAKLLLEGAIKNFNEKPDVAFEGKHHRVSPLEEAVKELLKRTDSNALLKLAERYLPKKD